MLVLAVAVAPAAAEAAAYLPPRGKVFAGVTGGQRDAFALFSRQVGHHPPVFQFFMFWGQSTTWELRHSVPVRARHMVHISTQGNGRELITPRAIALGRDDGYLLSVNREIAESGRIVYIRLMSEMNGHWNPYCAFSSSGRSRGPERSTRSFRQAWRRFVLVVRGGPVESINARLSRLRLPPLRTRAEELPRPRVSFLWVPQVAGSPDIPANSPRAYWPGGAYVDWVGTDFYSKFPNFYGLSRFYRQFPGKPFAFGEWALWVRDSASFVDRLFAWARSHGRTRMLMYNQGNRVDGPFSLSRYPRGRAALRRQLRDRRFVPYAPEFG